ncbi:MAG: hypothetical protein OXR62_02330 [Ahrensia sp.]|nr:hypothetical protein [Ahrensia sp.]
MPKSMIAIACWAAIVFSGTSWFMNRPQMDAEKAEPAPVTRQERTNTFAVPVSENGKPLGHFETRITYTVSVDKMDERAETIPLEDDAIRHLLRLGRAEPSLFMSAEPDLEGLGRSLMAALERPEIVKLELEYGRLLRRRLGTQ